MRLKILLLVLSFSTLSASLFANPVIDSVGVENQSGKKVILHKVAPKETYYAIARRYNVKPQAVINFNKSAVLHEGDIVKVPTDLPFAQAVAPAPVQTQVQTSTVAAGTVIQYKVAQHEYLYGLARRFNTTVEDIKKLNNLQSDNLKPGQVINIRQGAGAQPATQAAAPAPVQTQPVVQQQTPVTPPVQQQAQTTPANTGENGTIVQYKVTKHEYLYSVAKRFNSTVEDIKQRNNLKSNSLSPGMTLNILQGAAAGATAPVTATHPVETFSVQEKPEKNDTVPPARRDTTNVATIADSLNAEHHAPSKYGLFEKNEKGVATTLDDPTLDQSKKLILHRTAPIGTVIKITNPMTNRTTFAKVVGRFTDSESTKDVILVMTKSVAESLGALDKRFHVNISYGVPNE
ncbi:DPBB and LysM peptidoglycan-binding domain-containing protein [Mucilaginibacter jinjuensis]|uniref:LysM peptidoglycan-binding domain-containing protein n=1 Tax=Mucilaginibacter jinjuensis TaxID=1176721 RepID=A0ABY7T1C2_9SPHI|nr:LysM peptidoglycan-binding domain-containing protein [Mucilaginibacter jinjuensis]WCT10186.1 LysM peptidoglycan-binding domain-containing protein [Mucilaginibacter jinjuensis]